MGARSSCLVGLACFLQVAVATAIIVITALKLYRINIAVDGQTSIANVDDVCLLGKTDNGANLCIMAFGVSGVSILATAVLSILQCCTCNLCGLGNILDALFAAAGTVLWAVAGVVFHFYNKAELMASVPRPEWRLSITVLSFVDCALFGLMCLAAIWSLLSMCCGCCGSRRGGGKGMV